MNELGPDILKYGVPGLALALLFLGYRLLNQLLTLQGNDDIFKRKLTAVIIFMAASVIFFFGGIFGQKWSGAQANSVFIYISPSSMPDGVDFPTIKKGGEIYQTSEKGAKIEVKTDDQVMLDLYSMIKRIDYLKQMTPQVAGLNSTLKAE